MNWKRKRFPSYVAHDSGHWVGPRLDVTSGLPKFDVSGLVWRADHTDFTTIPRMSVPFEEWWMEAGNPDRGNPYAAHFRAYRKKPGEPESAYARRLDAVTRDAITRSSEFRMKVAPEAHWIVKEQQCHHLNKDLALPGGALVVALDDEGTLLSVTGSFKLADEVGDVSVERMMREGLREREELIEAFDLEAVSDEARDLVGETRDRDSITTAGWLGLALIGCSNVTCTAETKRRSHELSGRDLSGPDHTRYRVLEIDPMRSDNEGDGEGDDEPLHIVRGHFKDYREGAGLFGRINGVFYWEPHVRGNPERGKQVKDYQIADRDMALEAE